ncbi:hypothetical protein Fmac_023411 [Flemingia macrophylla]|uniref:Ubiquitin-like domain-containing protein n=1 Tax=Flemingia macrophylla TaxID=520843 RepID=A0ABD1LLM2_9FABA
MDALTPRRRWRRRWSEENTEDKQIASSPDSPTEWATVVLEVKVPACRERIPIEMDAEETVLKLKEKVLELEKMYAVPVDRVVLQSHKTHFELLDHKLLKDCLAFDYPDNEIDVYLKPPPPPPPPPRVVETEKLKVTVLPRNTLERIEVEVKAEENVAVLREKLEEIHQRVRFRLPLTGSYIFIYNESPMNETKSFRWHGVQHGDTILTFDGDYVEEYDYVPEDEDYSLLGEY